MKLELIRNMKSHLILYTVLILILAALINNAQAQLKVLERNPNYLTYNGEPLLLVCSVPPDNDFHVEDFDLTYLDRMAEYGANHVWIMIENFTRERWDYAINTPQVFYDKMEAIVAKAYEYDIIVGISLFGYGLVKYPYMYSFNAACTGDCDEGPGPLTDPWDFYDITNNSPEVIEARDGQKAIMKRIVETTWEYPNVYYSPGWELNCIWNSNVALWYKWVVQYMKSEGEKVNPDYTHLFALEKSVDPIEAYNLGADFIIDEDGNSQKVEGIPFVYWSMDGIYRGETFWNKDDEPQANFEFARDEFVRGAAGIASIWSTRAYEEEYLSAIASWASTVENWSDEPGQEITDEAVPTTIDGIMNDIPGDPDVLDFTDFSLFEITDITSSTGHPFVVDRAISVGNLFYTDREYVITYIPPDFRGLVWLKTPNDDKRISADPYLSYRINTEATIFVGFDTRMPTPPAWLNSWTSTNEFIVDDTGVEYELFRKDYPAGVVELGSNDGLESSCSMYIVLHKPTGDIDLVAPGIPSGFTLTPLFD